MISEEILLNKLNDARNNIQVFSYREVSEFFPSSALHPHPDYSREGYKRIDDVALETWSKGHGWKTTSISDRGFPNIPCSCPIQFTRIS